MAATRQPHTTAHCLPTGPKLENDLASGTSVLLTPDNTPTKDHSYASKGPSPVDARELSYQLTITKVDKDTKTSNKAILSRSHSDSRLDSPKPTQSKLTKPEPHSKCVVEEKYSKASGTCKNKARNGRSRKTVTKTKKPTATVNNSVGVTESKTTSTKSSTRQRQNRSSSVPENRNSTEQKNTLVTDYFPVRRSARVPSKDLKKQHQSNLEELVLSQSEDGLQVVDIVGKGRGVVATKPFRRGDFVVEYAGDLTTLAVAKDRENEYSENPDFGCYMYYFNFRNKSYCVDATAETDKLGRLLNHSKSLANCCTKILGIDNKPYLILVAARDVSSGEELLYDYGDRSKTSIESHPWLAL